VGRNVAGARRPGRRRLASLAVGAALSPMLASCGLLGGLSGSGLGAPAPLHVMSPAFRDYQILPEQYTCHGARLSPPLLWSGGLSRQPKSYAIVVDDGQAPITPYIYWIVFDISPNTTAIAQNQLPTGAREALNSKGTLRYDPPCPVANVHDTYRFTVYALNARLKLPEGAGLHATWSAIAAHVIAMGRLTASNGQ
jgi:Raf kinase inhibitor-like YbhB/YbcL family protein